MQPVFFEGAVEFKKPADMTDEQCFSIWCKHGFNSLKVIRDAEGGIPIPPAYYEGVDAEGFRFFVTAWQPSLEDINAVSAGRPIFIKTISSGLPPMIPFTTDAEGNGNF